MKKLLFLFATIMISCSLYSQQISQRKYPAAETLISSQEVYPGQAAQDFIDQVKNENIRELRSNAPLLDSSIVYQYFLDGDSALDYKNIHSWNDNGDKLHWLGQDWNAEYSKWINHRKSENTYTDDGKQLSFHLFTWNTGSSAWVSMYKDEMTYDENGYLNLWMRSEWNESSHRWDKWMKVTHENDESGKELEAILYYPDDDNEWLFSSKNENTYNPDGTLSSVLVYLWNVDADEWDPFYKHTYAYNTENLPEEQKKFLYESGEWVQNQKWEYQYTSSGKNEITTISMYGQDEWIYTERIEYTYDEQDNLVLRLDLTRETDVWINSVMREYNYDSNNNEVYHIRQNWDNSLGQWINDFKSENAFNEDSQQTLISSYDWKEPLNKWEGIYREGYIYDEIGNAAIYEIYRWDQVLDNWLIHRKYFNFYSLLEEILEQPAGGIRVYPNPVVNSLSIETGRTANAQTTFTLITITGETVRKGILKLSNQNLDLSDLPVGIYFLQIEDGQKRIIEKIIKQ